MDEAVRESRLRDQAHRRGWRLERSPATKPGMPGYGTYRLHDLHTRKPVRYQSVLQYRGTEDGFGLSLDDVERLLDQGV